MILRNIRLVGFRCFEDTNDIRLDDKINVFVGKNNTGKSTIIRSIINLQGFPISALDFRPNKSQSFALFRIENLLYEQDINFVERDRNKDYVSLNISYSGTPPYNDGSAFNLTSQSPIFNSDRPRNQIVPFIAKRKAVAFSHDITSGVQANVDGTLSYLYGRIDSLSTRGLSAHKKFCDAVDKIIGLEITTKQSPNGKEAGFYFDDNNFISLERMGDGVSEMVALIVELCTEKNKIFVLEEPETNLHPSGLKALLAMIRTASESNQFIIATHSNVVVRELGGIGGGKVFRVFRDGETHTSPSKVEEVERTPAAHIELLRELGYEFTDFDLHEGWLFLEESSAERIIKDILIPMFAPALRGRLRTYSAGGATKLEPSVSDFERLMVFVHLQRVYENRLWVRADGDEAGKEAVAKIRGKFSKLDKDELCTFEREQFELYYPSVFQKNVDRVLSIQDKEKKRKAKAALLQEVLDWTHNNRDEAQADWAVSAEEPIKLLKQIEAKIVTVG